MPDFGINSTRIKTSDGGFAYLKGAYIVKTDSHNQTQWEKYIIFNRTRTSVEIEYHLQVPDSPVWLYSLVETSDGSLVAVGVGDTANPYMGIACLIKTEPFLPLPTPSPIPTPTASPTASPTEAPTPYKAPIIGLAVLMAPIVIAVTAAVVITLLFFRKHMKPALSTN